MGLLYRVARAAACGLSISLVLAAFVLAGSVLAGATGAVAQSCVQQRDACIAQGRGFVWESANTCRCEAGKPAAQAPMVNPAEKPAVVVVKPTVMAKPKPELVAPNQVKIASTAPVHAERCVPQRSCANRGGSTSYVKGEGCVCITPIK